jgi:hypothetical protein
MSAQPPIPYPASQTDKRPSQPPHSSSLSPDLHKRANNQNYNLYNSAQPTSPPISANPSPNSGFGGATDAMIGPSAPWDPNNPAVPSYPSEETYLARYRAYSENFPPPQQPATNLATQQQQHQALRRDSLAYHDRNAEDSRNSTSSGPYSTAVRRPLFFLHYYASLPSPKHTRSMHSTSALIATTQHSPGPCSKIENLE